MLESLNKLLNDSLDAIVVSILIMVAATAVIPEWRSNRGYALAGVITGIIAGLIAQRSGVPDGASIGVTAVGVVVGPLTIARLHGRTLGDILDEVVRRRANGGADPQNTPPDTTDTR